MLYFQAHIMQAFFCQSMLNPSSTQAHDIYALFRSFHIAAFGMLALIIFLSFFISIKYRKKKNDDSIPKQTTGNKTLEIFMIGIPTLLLIYFFYQSFITMKAVEPAVAEGSTPDIIITGHQFWWDANYNNTKVVTANEIHLPAGKKILLELRAADVIHSFWVPALGNKMDMIPGKPNFIYLNIDKPGTYAGLCSEFCGAEHAWMRMDIVAQSEADYAKWIAENETDAHPPMGSLATEGSTIFQTSTCANCHRIRGTDALGVIGPDLTHFDSRKKMLGGMMNVDSMNIYTWISGPQKVKPGSKMPDFIFNKDSLQALTAYLLQLK